MNEQERSRLSQADVARLLADPSPAIRSETATKLAGDVSSHQLTEHERKLALEIIQIMTRDVAVQVREALSANLKETPDIPHEVAVALANDVESVALPILRSSPALTDEDLVSIVRGGDSVAKQVAIAGRDTVSETVSDALADTHNEDVVATLVGNDGAALTEQTLQRVLSDFPDSERVHTPLVHRHQLPITIAERLVTMVSDRLKDHLVTHHELPATVASDLVFQTRERATATLLSETSGGDVEELVYQMRVNGRLTPSLILRTLCMGDVTFFEASLANLARVSMDNTRKLIHDQGPLGLKAIYAKAGLPPELFPAVRTALKVVAETPFDGLPGDRERRMRLVIERILTQYEDFDLGIDNLDYLLRKLNDTGDIFRPVAAT